MKSLSPMWLVAFTDLLYLRKIATCVRKLIREQMSGCRKFVDIGIAVGNITKSVHSQAKHATAKLCCGRIRWKSDIATMVSFLFLKSGLGCQLIAQSTIQIKSPEPSRQSCSSAVVLIWLQLWHVIGSKLKTLSQPKSLWYTEVDAFMHMNTQHTRKAILFYSLSKRNRESERFAACDSRRFYSTTQTKMHLPTQSSSV